MKKKVIFWFRRDLRLEDNTALYRALKSGHPVVPLFIFDSHILDALEDRRDQRVRFIHQTLAELDRRLRQHGSSLRIRHGKPVEVWRELINELDPAAVFTNRDYEPYARQRDEAVADLLQKNDIYFYDYKDQAIFEKDEVLTQQGTPYTVYTPYRRRWEELLAGKAPQSSPSEKLLDKLIPGQEAAFPALEDLGFRDDQGDFPAEELPEEIIREYHQKRDYPAIPGTTRLGIHLRFGTVSIRHLVRRALELNDTWLSELIWREFFMMILWHFPHVVDQPFREKYAAIPWRNNEEEFQRWCEGQTGYPIVDAGMRELNQTGFMHNRVRMITASFLTKHLLIDWRWGEAYFAKKLLDYDLAANNGNWQWAAGCGCDAAPYFRIFNPYTQTEKFDPQGKYLARWVPERDHPDYPKPMVDHKFARERALDTYKKALDS